MKRFVPVGARGILIKWIVCEKVDFMILHSYLTCWIVKCTIIFFFVIGCTREQKESFKQIDQEIESTVVISHVAEQSGKGGNKMNVEQIIEQVRNADRNILISPEQIPSEAGTPLLKLLSEDDPNVRELALLSLHYSGGSPARLGIMESLDDKAENVRSVACKFLLDHAVSDDLSILHDQVRNNSDAYVREYVALSIGRLGNNQSAQVLNNQLEQEMAPDTKRAIKLALVKLGDKPMREDYLARLNDTDPTVRVKALEDFLYIQDKKMLPEIKSLLNDLRDAKNVAPAGHQYYIRVCDVTVQILDSYLDHPFDFDVRLAKRYKTEELYEAKNVKTK